MKKKALSDIPEAIRDTVHAEISAYGFGEVETRWLTALLVNDPLLPAPTAAAMVARVAKQPLGNTLLDIEKLLMKLPEPSSEILPAERRMTSVILQAVADRLTNILTQLSTGA